MFRVSGGGLRINGELSCLIRCSGLEFRGVGVWAGPGCALTHMGFLKGSLKGSLRGSFMASFLGFQLGRSQNGFRRPVLP